MPFKVGGKSYQNRDQYLKATGKRSKPTTTTTTVKKRTPVTTTTSVPLLTPEQRLRKAPPKPKKTTTTTTVKRTGGPVGVGKKIGKKASEGAKTYRQRLEDAKHFE